MKNTGNLKGLSLHLEKAITTHYQYKKQGDYYTLPIQKTRRLLHTTNTKNKAITTHYHHKKQGDYYTLPIQKTRFIQQNTLTHFVPMLSFHNLWKYQKAYVDKHSVVLMKNEKQKPMFIMYLKLYSQSPLHLQSSVHGKSVFLRVQSLVQAFS